MDIAEFVKARLDEDERTVKALLGASRFVGGKPDFTGRGGPAAEAYWDRFDPVSALRDIEAKRALLRRHEESRHGPGRCPNCFTALGEHLPWPCPTIRIVAATWDDHPDYLAGWAP